MRVAFKVGALRIFQVSSSLHSLDAILLPAPNPNCYYVLGFRCPKPIRSHQHQDLDALYLRVSVSKTCRILVLGIRIPILGGVLGPSGIGFRSRAALSTWCRRFYRGLGFRVYGLGFYRTREGGPTGSWWCEVHIWAS